MKVAIIEDGKAYVMDEDEGRWVTMNGRHVLIKNGKPQFSKGAKSKVRPLNERKDLVPKNIAAYYADPEVQTYGHKWWDEREAIKEEAQKRMDKILETEGEGEAFRKEYRDMKRKLYNLDRRYERKANKLEKKYGFSEWLTKPNHKAKLDIQTGRYSMRVTPKTRKLKPTMLSKQADVHQKTSSKGRTIKELIKEVEEESNTKPTKGRLKNYDYNRAVKRGHENAKRKSSK